MDRLSSRKVRLEGWGNGFVHEEGDEKRKRDVDITNYNTCNRIYKEELEISVNLKSNLEMKQ